MSGPRGGGLSRGQRAAARVTATIVSAGFCLLVAPAAHADLEDLLDIVIGAASAGPDPVDVADLPAGSVDLAASGVLQDPLAELDQLLHGEPGQLSPEPATESSPGTPTDTNSGDTTPTPANGEHHTGDSENSNNSTSFPKLSMPSGGNGGGGSGGGGNGSGAQGGNNTKTKSNTSAAKPGADLPKAEGDGVS
ncbi:hypothetical protein [Mycobacterium sp. UM_WGJ]|uniref:hypothetical protein n=1 Tax=Mycobacterium sp. UM_WGJ TaxID=1370120 RepID=UPI001E3C6856|nr:hypothetical protein [Mycobacterium sp. UM_WGJ]